MDFIRGKLPVDYCVKTKTFNQFARLLDGYTEEMLDYIRKEELDVIYPSKFSTWGESTMVIRCPATMNVNWQAILMKNNINF